MIDYAELNDLYNNNDEETFARLFTQKILKKMATDVALKVVKEKGIKGIDIWWTDDATEFGKLVTMIDMFSSMDDGSWEDRCRPIGPYELDGFNLNAIEDGTLTVGTKLICDRKITSNRGSLPVCEFAEGKVYEIDAILNPEVHSKYISFKESAMLLDIEQIRWWRKLDDVE